MYLCSGLTAAAKFLISSTESAVQEGQDGGIHSKSRWHSINCSRSAGCGFRSCIWLATRTQSCGPGLAHECTTCSLLIVFKSVSLTCHKTRILRLVCEPIDLLCRPVPIITCCVFSCRLATRHLPFIACCKSPRCKSPADALVSAPCCLDYFTYRSIVTGGAWQLSIQFPRSIRFEGCWPRISSWLLKWCIQLRGKHVKIAVVKVM